MNEPPFDPADEALLERAVRSMRDELPDDARMQRLAHRLAPVVVAETPSERSWPGRTLPFVAGAVVVMVGVFAGTQRRVDEASPSATSVPVEVAPAAPAAPPQPSSTADLGEKSPPVMPVVTVDSLPPAASQRSRSAPPPSMNGLEEGRSDVPASADRLVADGDELALLEAARAALATEPARTLALADEHTKRFSSPAFAQERERLAIEALVRSGRRDDASTRARRFESTYPRSPHLARVRALVGPPPEAP